MIQKSFNMLVEETKNNVINTLTESKLPATVVQMLLREIIQGVELQTQQILQQEKAQYQKMLQETTQKKEGTKNGNKERTGK